MAIQLVVGSKAEFYHYSRQILDDSGRTSKWVKSIKDLSGSWVFGKSAMSRPIVYVAGTGHLVPEFEKIKQITESRGGFVHWYDIPGLLIMPSLEIAHEFAEYLGIDPEWRSRSEEQGVGGVSTRR